jgi:hypothetical protein
MSSDSVKDGLTTSIVVTTCRTCNNNLVLRRVDVRVSTTAGRHNPNSVIGSKENNYNNTSRRVFVGLAKLNQSDPLTFGGSTKIESI